MLGLITVGNTALDPSGDECRQNEVCNNDQTVKQEGKSNQT